MKLFTKISLILAAITGGLGILAVVIGLALGADVTQLNDMGIHISPHQQVAVSRVITEVEEESIHIYHDAISELEEKVVEHNYIPTEEIIVQHHNEIGHNYISEEKRETKNNHVPEGANIEQHNYRHHNENLHNHTCNFRGINRLEVEVQNAQITIFASEDTQEFLYYSNKEKSIAKVEGSTLKLEDNSELKDKIELELYIPISVLKEIEIEAINATVLADKLIADNIKIEIDNASVQIDALVVEDKAELQINAGQMIIGCYDGKQLETECAMGSIMVVCEGKQSDYNYDLECGMGEIKVQNDSYSGIGKDLQIHNDSRKSIKAECALGEIIFEFPNHM